MPDGVAAVRLSYRNGTVIDAPVVNENVVSFTPPRALVDREHKKVETALHRVEHEHGSNGSARLIKAFLRIVTEVAPKSVEWLDGNGHLIKAMSPQVNVNDTFR